MISPIIYVVVINFVIKSSILHRILLTDVSRSKVVMNTSLLLIEQQKSK